MKTKKSEQAFTLIEMAVVFAIIGIVSALAVSSFIISRPRVRVRSDIWNLNLVLNNARIRAISENNNFGVAFYRKGSAPSYTYYYFVFKDANNNGVFDDLDGDPLHQCEFINQKLVGSSSPCTSGGEDPIVGAESGGAVYTLDSHNFFREILGNNFSSGSVISVIFESPAGKPDRGGDIFIQSYSLIDQNASVSYGATVRLNPATGSAIRLPITRKTLP